MRGHKLHFILKPFILLSFLVFSMNAFAHTSIHVSFGDGPVYYPAPFYYGPPPMVQNVVWVPTHVENGYLIPGHYVEYLAPAHYYRPHRHWYY